MLFNHHFGVVSTNALEVFFCQLLLEVSLRKEVCNIKKTLKELSL